MTCKEKAEEERKRVIRGLYNLMPRERETTEAASGNEAKLTIALITCIYESIGLSQMTEFVKL